MAAGTIVNGLPSPLNGLAENGFPQALNSDVNNQKLVARSRLID